MKKVFKKETLTEELELPFNAIEDKITEQSRWSTLHDIVFEYEGKFYATFYSEGSTESQG